METDYAEENISTEQSPTRQKARVPRTHGDEERPRSDQTPQGERPQETDCFKRERTEITQLNPPRADTEKYSLIVFDEAFLV